MKIILNLLRSMRFAVAILVVVAIASAIGSVLQQNQPYATYVSLYGELWSGLFLLAGLTDIYHAGWFFILLTFMAGSTGLCLAKNMPGMLKEMRSYRENKSLQSLRKSPFYADIAIDPAAVATRLRADALAYLKSHSYKSKIKIHNNGDFLIAARTGSSRRLGYILVHGAIVLICVGGLVDGNVFLQLKLLTGQLKVEKRDLTPTQVPAASRLPADAGSFRATVSIVEGRTQSVAYLSAGDGYLMQELPFSIKLNSFRVENYQNGRPKDFSSDVEIIDGKATHRVTLRVNHPFTYHGITLYQSGFSDGGTGLKMRLSSLSNDAAPVVVDGKVGGDATALLIDGEPYSLSLTDYKAKNVFSSEGAGDHARDRWFSQADAKMADVGASVAFELRDKLGQASAWSMFAKPIQIGGARYFVIGRRGATDADMRYARLPLDDADTLNHYRRFSATLRREPARQAAARAIGAAASEMKLAGALEPSTLLLLDVFAKSGFKGISDMVQHSIPPTEQIKAGQFYAELLQRAAMELYIAANLDQAVDAAVSRFVHDSLEAYSDTIDGQIGTAFELTDAKPVNSSTLQLTRAPGALLVYLGSALLALGVCAMYFVRERRLWIWVGLSTGRMDIGYGANRHNPGLQSEFDEHLKATLNKFLR